MADWRKVLRRTPSQSVHSGDSARVRSHPRIRLAPTDYEYETTALLGRGGYGEVWAARDLRTGEEVAIKRYSASPGFEEIAKEQFSYEIMVTLSLDHPSVVRGLGYSVDPLALVTERIDGISLHDYLKAFGPVDVATAVSLGAQVAQALQATHDLGVIHRDVQPENIMVTRTMDAKLIDFGMATPFAPGTRETTVNEAKRDYMAPERADFKRAEGPSRGIPQSDLYSLGVVLYEMVKGSAVDYGFDYSEWLDWRNRRIAPHLTAVAPDAPPELSSLVSELMAVDPSQRPISAHEVSERLDAIRELVNRDIRIHRVPTEQPPEQYREPYSVRSPEAGVRGLTGVPDVSTPYGQADRAARPEHGQVDGLRTTAQEQQRLPQHDLGHHFGD